MLSEKLVQSIAALSLLLSPNSGCSENTSTRSLEKPEASETSISNLNQEKESEATGDAHSKDGKISKAKSLVDRLAKAVADQQPETKGVDDDKSAANYLETFNKLLKQTKESGSSSADTIAKFLGDYYDQATHMGSDGMERSVDWAKQAYEVVKSQGLTTAVTASQWVSSELHKSKSWEYRVIPIGESTPATLEKQLNELGAEGWECFAFNESGGVRSVVCKRRQQSMLSHIPIEQAMSMLKLLQSQNN